VILKFPNSAARDAFLDRLEGATEAQDMRIRPSNTQPDVLTVRPAEAMTEQQLRSQLKPFLEPEVKVFEDVQFSPLV
jgi:hypothetical protein